MTKPPKRTRESTAAEWNMITAKAEIEKLESEMNFKKMEFEEIRTKRRDLSLKILKLKRDFHRLREKLNSMFYHPKTLEEIDEQMDFDPTPIPDDDFELGNISALKGIPMYDDSSPEEDEYVQMSDELFESVNDMATFNSKFEDLNETIEKYKEMITQKEDEIKEATSAEQVKVETKSLSDAFEINRNRTADSNVVITIPEFVSPIPHRFQDSSPDNQEYHELKSDFVNKINDEFAVFNEARTRLKTPSTAKKSVYGAPIQSNSLRSIVRLAQKRISKVKTSLANQQEDEGDQYTSFRDELCNDNCKPDCKCKMQSRIAIK